MADRRREQLSDHLRRGSFVFAQPTSSFEKAFPEIAELSGTVEITDFGRPVARHALSRATAGEFIDCPNPRCTQGGFRLGGMLRNMIARGVSEDEQTQKCAGYEGSPKGRRRYRDCLHMFNVKAVIKYRRPVAGSNE